MDRDVELSLQIPMIEHRERVARLVTQQWEALQTMRLYDISGLDMATMKVAIVHAALQDEVASFDKALEYMEENRGH